jgi:hypothetical protein
VKKDIRKDLYERFIRWCGENSINICLERALSLLEKSSTNTVSKSDELKPRVFCKSKSEIRDVSRYVKKLKDEGVLIDWWDEGSKYCFEVRE